MLSAFRFIFIVPLNLLSDRILFNMTLVADSRSIMQNKKLSSLWGKMTGTISVYHHYYHHQQNISIY